MTIRLWDGLDDLNFLVGADFPDADEDALRRCGEAWSRAATELRHLTPEAVAAGLRVLESLGGDAATAFGTVWDSYTADAGFVERLADACHQLAAACDNAATEVEYAKIQYIAALVLLGATIAALVATIWAGGVSAAGIPVAVAAAQITIRLIIVRLLTAMVVGAGVNLAVDAVAQSVQLANGHRDEWDWAKSARAAEDGAIFGAVGGGVFLLGGRLAPGWIHTPAGLATGAGVTGVLGGVAAPLAHGELPTGRDVLLSLTSGVAGGLGPDLVHGRVPGPDLSGLGALDPAARSGGGSGLGSGSLEPTSDASPGGGQPHSGGHISAPADRDASSAGWAAGTGAPRAAETDPNGHERVAGTGRAPAATGPELVGAAVRDLPPTRGEAASPPGGYLGALGSMVARPDSAASGAPGPGPTPVPGTVIPIVATGVVSPAGGGAAPSASAATPAPSALSTPPSPSPPLGPSPSSPAPAPSALSGATAAVPGSATLSAAGAVHGPIVAAGLPGPTPAALATVSPEVRPTDPVDPGRSEPPVPWALTDDEATALVRTNAFATDAGIGFYAVDDEIREFAEAVLPVDGFVTLDLHGSPKGFQVDDHVISPEQFAGALRDLMADGTLRLPDGHGIKLLSCDTAAGGVDSPAAQLAHALGVEVIAPDLPVWTTLDGEEIVASPTLVDGNLLPADPPDGAWHRFGADGVEVPFGDSRTPRADPPIGAPDRGLADYALRGPDIDWNGIGPEELTGRDPIGLMDSIPVGWEPRPSNSGGGVVYADPHHTGRQIRVMPGYPDGNRPDPMTRGPYAVLSSNGERFKIPLLGNPVLEER